MQPPWSNAINHIILRSANLYLFEIDLNIDLEHLQQLRRRAFLIVEIYST